MVSEHERARLWAELNEHGLERKERQLRWFRYHRHRDPQDATAYNLGIAILENRLSHFSHTEMLALFTKQPPKPKAP